MTLQAHKTHNINLSHAQHITDNLLRAKSFHDIVTQQTKNSRGGKGEKSSIHLTPHPPNPANLGAEIDWAKWLSYARAPNDNDADENVIFANNVDAMITLSKYETYVVWEFNSD